MRLLRGTAMPYEIATVSTATTKLLAMPIDNLTTSILRLLLDRNCDEDFQCGTV